MLDTSTKRIYRYRKLLNPKNIKNKHNSNLTKYIIMIHAIQFSLYLKANKCMLRLCSILVIVAMFFYIQGIQYKIYNRYSETHSA